MAEADGGAERREHERFFTELSVDYSSGENFLFSYITNISEMGIFIRTDTPPEKGTRLRLRFGLADGEMLKLEGVVMWINEIRADGDNPNPGIGVRFLNLTPEQREKVVDLVRTIAYLQKD
ncbi:MAG: TIGR02266 family protein [Sandaracinaceae bacterium]